MTTGGASRGSGAGERVRALLARRLGRRPDHVVRSPGRVNLVGDHTDYNDGLAMPLAIDRELALAVAVRDDDRVRLVSELDDTVHEVDLAGVTGRADAPDDPRWPSWTVYVQGVLRAIDGDLSCGVDLAVASDLPEGAGLSSSAALELGVARCVAAVTGRGWDPSAAARAGRVAENDWVCVSTGIMDQLAVAHGRAGHVMVLDCADSSWRDVAVPVGLDLVVLDTGARRSLVGSAYDDRRRDCRDAADRLGVTTLREVDDVAALQVLPDRLRARARHVVTENDRVRTVAHALPAGDLATVGAALRASHASLRDDYDVTGPELDTMADVANAADGVVGARMTGGGFGGAVVALVRTGGVDVEEIITAFRRVHDLDARALVVRPSDGTSLVSSG